MNDFLLSSLLCLPELGSSTQSDFGTREWWLLVALVLENANVISQEKPILPPPPHPPPTHTPSFNL